MAGVSIAMSNNIALDVGYRFVSLGEVSTTATAFQGGGAVGTSTLNVDNLYGHEFKVGIRVGLDGLMSRR
jgi:opacity protein-like surface antigen